MSSASDDGGAAVQPSLFDWRPPRRRWCQRADCHRPVTTSDATKCDICLERQRLDAADSARRERDGRLVKNTPIEQPPLRTLVEPQPDCAHQWWVEPPSADDDSPHSRGTCTVCGGVREFLNYDAGDQRRRRWNEMPR